MSIERRRIKALAAVCLVGACADESVATIQCPTQQPIEEYIADALPPKGATGLQAVTDIVDTYMDQLLIRFQGVRVEVGPGWGRVWIRDDGTVTIEEVEDFMIQVILPAGSECRDTSAFFQGVPVAYAIEQD